MTNKPNLVQRIAASLSTLASKIATPYPFTNAASHHGYQQQNGSTVECRDW